MTNAFTYLVPTTIGALAGGYLSDKLESKSYMNKSYIIIVSLLISSPFAYLAFMNMDDFWFSTEMINVQWLFSEAWFAPCLVML